MGIKMHTTSLFLKLVKMAPNSNDNEITNPNECLIIPKWISEDYFTPILEKDVDGFQKIVKFTPIAATAPGENYTSIMVRVVMDVVLKDGSTKTVSYILKTALEAGNDGAAFVSSMNLFPKETQMYVNCLEKFERLYKDAGVDLQLSPKCLHYDLSPERTTLVMEDLSRENYTNMDRLSGFDMDHMRVVLGKLAEFHAASAVLHEQSGPYADIFQNSFFNESNKPMIAAIYDARTKLFIKAMRNWGLEDIEKYIAKMVDFESYFEENMHINRVDPNEFNVLNHGDMWTNNIMFVHDKEGAVKSSKFVDFQLCKWGSPAQDLWYLFTTSVQLDIRVKEFDHFIEIYYRRLVECLKLLNYSKPIPNLKDIHILMLKYSYWGFFTANSLTANVLFPKDKDANIDSMLKPGPEADEFRFKVFTAPIFAKSMRQWYPFLYNKGALDINKIA